MAKECLISKTFYAKLASYLEENNVLYLTLHININSSHSKKLKLLIKKNQKINNIEGGKWFAIHTTED